MPRKRKHKILRIIRRSCLTGQAVWLSHQRSYKVEWAAYKKACMKEINRMRQWGNTVSRRKKNVMQLIGHLTASLPTHSVSPEQREAAKELTQMADNEPPKQSNFYDHIREEKRQKRNASRRDKRWREKYGDKNEQNRDYDKLRENSNGETS